MPIFRRKKALLLHLVYIGLVLLDVVGSGCGALLRLKLIKKNLIVASFWSFLSSYFVNDARSQEPKTVFVVVF